MNTQEKNSENNYNILTNTIKRYFYVIFNTSCYYDRPDDTDTYTLFVLKSFGFSLDNDDISWYDGPIQSCKDGDVSITSAYCAADHVFIYDNIRICVFENMEDDKCTIDPCSTREYNTKVYSIIDDEYAEQEATELEIKILTDLNMFFKDFNITNKLHSDVFLTPRIIYKVKK